MTPKQFFAFAKKHGAEMIDLKFVDMLGSWQHCSFPTESWDEGTFKSGVGRANFNPAVEHVDPAFGAGGHLGVVGDHDQRRAAARTEFG